LSKVTWLGKLRNLGLSSNGDLRTTTKSSGTVGRACERCSAVRGAPALHVRHFLSVSVTYVWHSFNGEAHTDTRRQGEGYKRARQWAQGAVAILAPGRVAVKCQRADAMKKPMRSPCTCEPAGTMHRRCERYTSHAHALEKFGASQSECRPRSIGGLAAEAQRAHHMCARREEATAPDAARRATRTARRRWTN
jgi:hypothetical protein